MANRVLDIDCIVRVDHIAGEDERLVNLSPEIFSVVSQPLDGLEQNPSSGRQLSEVRAKNKCKNECFFRDSINNIIVRQPYERKMRRN